jgi:peptidoglycan hydrolase-like protein with peptidoglycan-binding domain
MSCLTEADLMWPGNQTQTGDFQMRLFVVTTIMAFVVGLFAAGQVLGAAEQESGKAKSGSAAQMEPSGQQRSADMEQQSQRQAGAAGQAQKISAQQLSSDQVKQIQQALQDKGVSPGPVDGVVGPKTKQALRQFQQDQGIAGSGQINEQTLQALDLEAQEFMGVSPQFGEQEQQREQKEEQKESQQEPLQKQQEDQMKQQQERKQSM